MSVDVKKDYALYLGENPKLPIYVQDWYLDLVCGAENWNVVIVKNGAHILAVLPYFVKRHRYFTWIGMPPLSKLHGPYLSPKFNNSRHHHAIVDALIDQLPEVAFYQQATGYGFTNWLPYLWKGYSQVTLYSYVFREIDLEKIWNGLDPDIRRRIRRSESTLTLRTDLSLDFFYNVFALTFKRQNLPVPFSLHFLQKYYNTLVARSAAQLLFVVDQFGEVQSAALIVWDENSAYYLLEGSDPDSGNKNAGIFLKWAAVRYSRQVLNLDRFDFEGSISRRIEKIYREFGAEATPYFVIKKYKSRIFLALKFIQNVKQYGKLVQW